MACWPRPSWNSSSPYVAHKRFVYRPSSHHKGRSARSRSPDINPLTSLPPPGIIRVAGRGLTPQGSPCLLLFTPFSREGNQCNGNAASYRYEQFRLRPVPRPSYADGTTCFPPGNELPLCSGTACHSVPKLVSYAMSQMSHLSDTKNFAAATKSVPSGASCAGFPPAETCATALLV